MSAEINLDELKQKFAEAQKKAADRHKVAGTTEAAGKPAWTWKDAREMSTLLFIFVSLVMLFATILLWKRNVDASQLVRLFLIVLIVSLSAFLVVAGYDEKQLVPVIGLFGAICGYLLGRDSTSRPTGGDKSREAGV